MHSEIHCMLDSNLHNRDYSATHTHITDVNICAFKRCADIKTQTCVHERTHTRHVYATHTQTIQTNHNIHTLSLCFHPPIYSSIIFPHISLSFLGPFHSLSILSPLSSSSLAHFLTILTTHETGARLLRSGF